MFVQEHGHGKGLGLGLTLARILAEQHGGRIDARSEGAGRGSTFTISLPLAAAGDEAPRAAADQESVADEDEESEESHRAYRVVVVEDHPDVRESLRELLLFWGHSVDEAEDGEQGLATILRVRPDIAFVDIGMPKLDGYTVARCVREKMPGVELRLIALTGFGQKADVARTRAAGFDGHLVKPATPQAIRQAFEELEKAEAARGSA
jgi:CheY-like chemotaxis protein